MANVRVERTDDGGFRATNDRGAEVRLGSNADDGVFTPVELLLAGRDQSTVAVYRTELITDELRELQERYGLVLVVGQEHDPRAKERLSASGLSRQVPDIADREVVLAGPRHFTRYVRGALARLAVPGTQVTTASVRLRQRA